MFLAEYVVSEIKKNTFLYNRPLQRIICCVKSSFYPFCSAEQNELGNFVRGLLCEIILNLGVLFLAVLFSRAESFEKLTEGIMKNISVKLILIWAFGSGRGVV